MWRRIELRNYRSIETARVDLAPFTVLIGPNGSGKSNFADAFVFISELPDASNAVARRGGIAGMQRWQQPPHHELFFDLRVSDSKEHLDTTYIHYQGALQVDQGKHWSFQGERFEVIERGASTTQLKRSENGDVQITADGVTLPLLAGHSSLMLLAKQLLTLSKGKNASVPAQGARRYRLNPDAMRQPHPDSDASHLNESGSNIAEAIQNLREQKDGSFEDVIDSMTRIVPGLVDIGTPKVGHFRMLEFRQQQMAGGIASFSPMEMSDGALRALGILVAARQVDAESLLIIEEPEVNLHPGATAVLFEALKQASQRGAVLITTHSPELLDAAKDEEILVCDYRSGVTRIGPLAAEQRQVVRDGLFSVAELMRTTSLRIEGDEPAALAPPTTP